MRSTLNREKGDHGLLTQMTTRKPPVADLTSFADEHLVYEVQMFLCAKSMNPQDQLAHNVAVEITALHFRNLLNFFYPPFLKVDDVVACDYVNDWEQRQPAITTDLENARKRANREVAHLTAQRIPGPVPEKAWKPSELADLLRPVVVAFLAAPNLRVSDRTRNWLKQI
jgi:hypothetical protein